jgi:hypothetical protein
MYPVSVTAQPNWLKPECDIRPFWFVLPKIQGNQGKTTDFHITRINRHGFVEPQCIVALLLGYQQIRKYLIFFA